MIGEDKWRVVEPGVLALAPTGIEIRRDDEGILRVWWRDRTVPGHGYYLTLDSAKDGAARVLADLLALGYDP